MEFTAETAAIRDYLASTGVPFNVTFTTGGTHAAGSYHYLGLAADIGSVPPASPAGLAAIYNALLPVAHLTAELIVGGHPQWKNGVQVADYDTASNIWNHVHVAVPKGRILLPLNSSQPKEIVMAKQIVAALPSQSGNGYYLVDDEGHVFAFGDAVWHGGTHLDVNGNFVADLPK